jgi:hypothetical protein
MEYRLSYIYGEVRKNILLHEKIQINKTLKGKHTGRLTAFTIKRPEFSCYSFHLATKLKQVSTILQHKAGDLH